MSDPLEPIRAQRDDFAALLGATRALLAGALDSGAVAAFRAERSSRLKRTGRRDARVVAALTGPATPELEALAAEYRGVLEALVEAERDLARRAGGERDALGRELADLVQGRRALAGYRSSGSGTPRAVSRRI
jgi:hypothetical protein